MTLQRVRKATGLHVGDLAPEDEAALRAVKGGQADQEAHETYHSVVKYIHAEKLWIRCDCHGETDERPVIVPRRLGANRFSLANLPHASVRHARGCVFGPIDEGGDAAVRRESAHLPIGDILDPFSPGDKRSDVLDPDAQPDWSKRFTGTAAGRQVLRMRSNLHMLMEAARLHRYAETEGFASPKEWLARIEIAAQQFYLPTDVQASELLFTDPDSWRGGEVARRLDVIEADRQKPRKPFALLCWIAHDVQDHEINRDCREAGYVRTDTEIVRPMIGRNPVSGPWLFLGAVARQRDEWVCLKAYAQPIVSLRCPVPVDSHPERRAWVELRRLVEALRDDEDLHASLGGRLRVELEKPLFQYSVEGGRCLPDFLVTVSRPGESGDLLPGVPRAGRQSLRYVIEVMGFDTPKYEDRKARTHFRMRWIGHVCRLEAKHFDSRHFGLERQCEKLTRQVRKNLLRRWEADGGRHLPD